MFTEFTFLLLLLRVVWLVGFRLKISVNAGVHQGGVLCQQ